MIRGYPRQPSLRPGETLTLHVATDRPHFRVEGCSFHMESHPRRYAVREYSDGAADAQEVNMIRTFSGLVVSGRVDPSWGDIALKTQLVLDACLQSARADGRPVPLTG